jgi:hypothetical protein
MSSALAVDEEGLRIGPSIWDEMMAHPGKWVVATGDGILAIADKAKDVLRSPAVKHVEGPLLLLHVPDQPKSSLTR